MLYSYAVSMAMRSPRCFISWICRMVVRTIPPPCALSSVQLVEQPQPDLGQPRLDAIDDAGLGGHQRRELAGGDDHGRAAELGPDPPDQPFDQRDVAEHGAGQE